MTLTTEISEPLRKVIRSSWFTIDTGIFVYTKVRQVENADKHLLVIRDRNEITVVTDETNLPFSGDYETNKEKWKLINIRCGNPFYCVGFIAAITGALAEAGIDIVLTSSFSNDLVLVMENDLEKSIEVLKEIGFSERVSG
ncbi:MAG: ACT domain-containing protein [Chitinophagaceae bacterium]